MINRQSTFRRPVVMEALEPRRVLAPLLSLEGPSEVVFEGERAAFTLRLSEPARQAESVFVTTRAGTATPGVDYAASERLQLNFAPGESSKQFFVSTLAEAVPRREGNETFFVTARPVNPQLSGALTRQVTIGDAMPIPSLAVADIRVTEGSTGSTAATFTLTLSASYQRRVTVAYATRDGSATVADNDYTASSGTVTFLPGTTTQTVTVSVNGDTRLEPDEVFSLFLSSPTNTNLVRTVATCTIVNDETDMPGFQITLNYDDPNLPANQRAVFQRAVNRLQQIIVGDLPGVTLNGGVFIDDMRVNVFVETMAANLNGYARATQFRPGARGLPYDGEIHINVSRIDNPGIYHTIIHEMLHALGFYGNFFQSTGTVSGLGTNQPLFIGANATREYGTYFGIASPTGVPLFGDQTQLGSYGSHWDTNTVGTEIMSVGWDTTSTALRPFSRMTVGAMQDIGYEVNYGAADPYRRGGSPDTRPGGGAVTTPTPATPATPTASRPPVARPPLSLRPSLRPQLGPSISRETVAASQQSKLTGTRLNSPAVADLAGLSMTAEAGLPRKTTAARFFANLAAS